MTHAIHFEIRIDYLECMLREKTSRFFDPPTFLNLFILLTGIKLRATYSMLNMHDSV